MTHALHMSAALLGCLLVACGGEPPELTIQEDAVDFGIVKVGELGTGALTLWNSGDGLLEIDIEATESEGDEDDFTITLEEDGAPITLDDGERKTVVVAFWPKDVGVRTATVTVRACGTAERHGLLCCGESAEDIADAGGCEAYDVDDVVELSGEGI